MFDHLTGDALANALKANAEPRAAALAMHLDTEVTTDNKLVYDLHSFTVGTKDYLVLTDAEADERAAECVKETLWAFNPSFLADYIPALHNAKAAAAWTKMVGEICEDATPLVEAMLGDRLDEMVEDAIAADGRAHFLNTYDGEEHEVTVNGVRWYVYRTN